MDFLKNSFPAEYMYPSPNPLPEKYLTPCLPAGRQTPLPRERGFLELYFPLSRRERGIRGGEVFLRRGKP